MFNHHDLTSEKLQFEKIYSELYTTIHSALIEAENSGKKLLIILAEQHSSLYSFVLQSLLLLVVNELRIKNLIVEFSEKFVNLILSSPRPNKTLNSEFSIPFAKRDLKMKITPADLDYIELNLSNERKDEIRETEMIRRCCQTVDNHALFIVGSNHLKPLTEHLKTAFHVLPINASKISLLETMAFNCITVLNYISPKIVNYGPCDLGERYDFVQDSKEVVQIDHPLDLDYLSHQNIVSAIKKWYKTFNKFSLHQLSENTETQDRLKII